MLLTVYAALAGICFVCDVFGLAEPAYLSIVIWLPFVDSAIVAAIFSRRRFRCACGETFRLGWWKLFNLCLIFKIPRTRGADGYRRTFFHNPAWVTCPSCGKWECGAVKDDRSDG